MSFQRVQAYIYKQIKVELLWIFFFWKIFGEHFIEKFWWLVGGRPSQSRGQGAQYPVFPSQKGSWVYKSLLNVCLFCYIAR
jgi:hypothetical protein